jgi:hypothetical protein
MNTHSFSVKIAPLGCTIRERCRFRLKETLLCSIQAFVPGELRDGFLPTSLWLLF